MLLWTVEIRQNTSTLAWPSGLGRIACQSMIANAQPQMVRHLHNLTAKEKRQPWTSSRGTVRVQEHLIAVNIDYPPRHSSYAYGRHEECSLL